jgi:hypothetical protein
MTPPTAGQADGCLSPYGNKENIDTFKKTKWAQGFFNSGLGIPPRLGVYFLSQYIVIGMIRA